MKKIVLLAVFIASSIFSCFSQEKVQVKNFNKLMDALTSGHEVRTVLHYAKCDLYVDGEKQDRKIDAIGGMPVDVYEYFSKDLFGNTNAFLSASQTKLIQNPKGKGYVYNYVKIRVYDNNKVEIIARYLHPRSLKEKMAEKFTSHINNGENDGGVYFYMD